MQIKLHEIVHTFATIPVWLSLALNESLVRARVQTL